MTKQTRVLRKPRNDVEAACANTSPLVTPREHILNAAKEATCGDRNLNYGNPEDNFADIADFWSVYKGVNFTSHDVAVMCVLIKVARLKKSPNHIDSAVDIAGYAACLGDIQCDSSNSAIG